MQLDTNDILEHHAPSLPKFVKKNITDPPPGSYVQLSFDWLEKHSRKYE